MSAGCYLQKRGDKLCGERGGKNIQRGVKEEPTGALKAKMSQQSLDLRFLFFPRRNRAFGRKGSCQGWGREDL